MTVDLKSFIGGAWREGASLAADVNPAKPSEVIATVHMGCAQLAEEAVNAARAAFAAWRSTTAPARGDILRKAADLLKARATAAGKKTQLEMGGKNPSVVLAEWSFSQCFHERSEMCPSICRQLSGRRGQDQSGERRPRVPRAIRRNERKLLRLS